MKIIFSFFFLILFSFSASSFSTKPKPIESENKKEISDQKKPSEEELAKEKIKKIDNLLNSMGMKGIKETMQEAQDEEERIKLGAGCLKFINIASKKKGLLVNLGLMREELYKARFRNNCNYGIEFKFVISFIDKDGFVFQSHNSSVKEIGKNTIEEMTEEINFFPASNFGDIKEVQVKIKEEMLLRPSVPKNLVQ